ncbi:hypothetical protein Z946_897 [Sulfitobacter noctilucicola]|nr:hypothetical protein Z946_897 [Sulfitobacter noctilucicola]
MSNFGWNTDAGDKYLLLAGCLRLFLICIGAAVLNGLRHQ